MDKEFEKLKSKWEQGKSQHPPPVTSSTELVKMANSKKKASIYFHYGNVVVLSIFLVLVIIFFYVVYNFADLVSNIGVTMMVAGLLIRIVVELISIRYSRNIQVTSSASQSTADTIRFLRLRKTIHGPITITMVAIYVVGYFLLNPELARHLGWKPILLWDCLAAIAAIIIIWQIRKSIRGEIRNLSDIVDVQKSLFEDSANVGEGL